MESLARKLKEPHRQNITLLEIAKTLGGSTFTTHCMHEYKRKAKKRGKWLKHYDSNGYCFYCGYEVTVWHNSATCNQKIVNPLVNANFNNVTWGNTLGGRTRNKPLVNTCQYGACSFKPMVNIIEEIQLKTMRTTLPYNANHSIKNL